MSHRTLSNRFRRTEGGFTLLEVLVVVAIIGLLSSVAVPAYQRAMVTSRRNAAVADLRVFKDAMQRWAAEVNRYPTMAEFKLDTLQPLDDDDLKGADKILRRFSGHTLDLYLPWNIITDPLLPSTFQSPQGFFVLATLDYDRSTRFIVTDSMIYLYADHLVTTIDN